MRRGRVPLWCWWIGLVLAISFPWGGLTGHPQWQRVHAIPFSDPADKARDFLANIALFVPFGYSFARGRGGTRGIAAAIAVAAAVSVGAETTQLFSTSRFPSATDVTAALLGTLLGALWKMVTLNFSLSYWKDSDSCGGSSP